MTQNWKKKFQKRRTYQKTRGRTSIKKLIQTEIKKYEKKNVELKWFTYITGTTPTWNINPSWTPTIIPFCLPPQGDTDTTRDGDKINIKSIQMRGHIFNMGGQDEVFRIIILKYKPTDTIPLGTTVNIFKPNATVNPIGTSMMTTASYSVDYRSNFSIIYDKTFCTTNQINTKNIKFYKKCSIPTQFVSNLINNGHNILYCLVMNNLAPGTTSYVQLAFCCRYTDS